MTLLVAQVSVATGIGPNDLLEAPAEVFWAMVAVLREQSKEGRRG